MNQATAWAWGSAACSLEDWSDTNSTATSAAPASTEGMPDAGAMAVSWVQRDFFAQQQPQLQPDAHLHEHGIQSPLTAVQKEKMKLRKKLREIQKIEQLMTTAEKVDPLQIQKVDKKDKLLAQLE